MSKMDDLQEYVAKHPRDHEKRWRLAKRLYKEGEYEQALGHLEVVKQYRTPKIHVVRYIAAAYYRLERFDAAVSELRQAIEEFSDDLSLREQLARVLRQAGRLEEALNAWQAILERQPDHALAQKAVASLTKESEAAVAAEEAPLEDEDLGIEPPTGPVCPNCGAANAEEFERCWKCHALLTQTGAPMPAAATPLPKPPRQREPLDLSSAWHLVAGVAIVVFVAAGFFFTARHYLLAGDLDQEAAIPQTVQELVGQELLIARLVLGFALLVVWPLALWVAGSVARAEETFLVTIVLTGVFFASLTYVALFLPLHWVAKAFLAVLLLAAVPILVTFRCGVARGLLLWLVHAALVLATAVVVLVAVEGLSALTQFSKTAQFARIHDSAPDAGRYCFPQRPAPVDITIRWQSTGSTWLDKKAGKAAIEVSCPVPPSVLKVELSDASGTLHYEHARAVPYRFTVPAPDGILIDHPYDFAIRADDGTEVDVTIYGVLTPVLSE